MISQALLAGAFTASIAIASTLISPVLNALQVDAVAQTTNNNSHQQTDTPTLSSRDVDAIAAQTTVVIGQDLQKGDVEARREFNPGSGVIIAKRGKTYYVATNLHVVRGRGGFYGVRTYDGEVYPVDDESTRSNIYLLGEEQGENAETINGFDLAIIQFDSNKNYPLATVNNTSQLNRGDRAFVSGWPDPGDETVKRQRLFAPGEMSRISTPSTDGGYNLQYTCGTQRGMSGGPVFNAKGEVIGIHGRAGEARSVFHPGSAIANLMKQAKLPENRAIIPYAATSNSNLGIQVNYLMDAAGKSTALAPILKSLEFDYPPVSETVISMGQNRPRSADVIDDIYKTFSRDFKHAAVRDCPSGGSGTLLLGGSDDRCED